MEPVYWIPALALLGGILGYFIFRTTGWLGTTVGVVVGALIGALLYNRAAR
jgi:hypothetical protein